MDATGHASADVTFFGKGPHVVTASYNGGFGPFHPAEAEPRTITVDGQPLTFGPLFGSATYGAQGRFDVALFTTDTTLPVPTGTIQILRDGIVIGQAGLVADPAGSGLIVVRAQVVLGSAIEPGAHPITIAYTGDATYTSKSAEATYNVFKRRPDVVLDPPFPNPATVGEDVFLSGRLVLPAGDAGAPERDPHPREQRHVVRDPARGRCPRWVLRRAVRPHQPDRGPVRPLHG